MLTERYLQTIMNASPDIIVLKDAKSRWLFANERTLKIFDIDDHVYKGKTDYELGQLFPHYMKFVPDFTESDRLAWEAGQEIDFEEVITIDGKDRTFEVIKVPIYNTSGEPDSIAVIGRDITERIESELCYKSLFYNHPNAVYSLDINGKFLDLNKEAERMSGYSKEELIGTYFPPLIADEDLPLALAEFQKVQAGESCSQEIKVIHKNGNKREIILTTIPASLHGKVIGIQGIGQDVTEKNNAVRQVEELKRVLQDTVRQQQGMTFKFTKQNGEFIHTLCDGELLYKIGLTPSDVVGKPLIAFYDKKTADEKQKYYERAWAGEEVSYELHVQSKSIIYLTSLRPIMKNNKVIEVIGSAIDITKRKQAEKALHETEEKYRIIAEHSSDMIRILDDTATIVYASPSNQRMLGHRPSDLLGRNALHFLHPDDQEHAQSALDRVLSTHETVSTTIRYQTANGDWKWVESTLSPVIEENNVTSIVVVSRDVTDRKALEERLRFMAYHDTLTGLPNRRMFDEEMEREIRRASHHQQAFAVLYFDVDRFKVINDTLGHNIGDLLLAAVAKKLHQQITKDMVFARMGGDEFAMLVPNIQSIEYVEQLAKQILSSLREPFFIEGHEVYVTTSVGISLYPEHSTKHKELLKQADIAMYQSKDRGKNNYQFYALQDKDQRFKKLYLENDLRKALSRQELFLMYQPKVELATNELVGCEVLLRWGHPEWGVVTPDEFIPIAEESGLIIPIGEWVIRTACKQLKQWLDQGCQPFQIAINLSLKQLLSKGFLQMVYQIFEECKINPSYIEFELTESVMMKDFDSTIELLYKLKEIGITVAIDDFGTGYSSLSHLKRFPLDVIKIDRSFVRDIPEDEEDKAITSLIISMGKHLHLQVVAEGVETKAQLEFLKEKGCDQYQGYYFSRPLTTNDIEKLLKARIIQKPSPDR